MANILPFKFSTFETNNGLRNIKMQYATNN